MAGLWIKWTKGLADRPEVIIISSRLQRDRNEIAGRLMRLWEWLDDNFDESNVDESTQNVSLYLGDRPRAILDEIFGIVGFAESMELDQVGWLTINDDGFCVFHRLARHNGNPAKQRALDQRKKEKKRSSSRFCPGEKGTSVPMRKGQKRDQRREEKNTDTYVSVCGETKPRSRLFTPPTLEEVRAYCIERKSSVDPEAFIAHYESNGWHVGNRKMANWKSAVITWEKNDARFGRSSSGIGSGAAKSRPGTKLIESHPDDDIGAIFQSVQNQSRASSSAT